MQSSVKVEGEKSGLATGDPETKSERTHTFRFHYKDKKHTVTCDVTKSVLESLLQTEILKAEDKNKWKEGKIEIVIQRELKPQAAVTPHFPCRLISKDELLKISLIKSSDGTRQTVRTPELVVHSPENLVCFYIKTRGEENIRKPMKNNELQRKINYVCVYAVKGEQMKAALKRDGRFNGKLFSKGALRDEDTETIMTLSNVVNYSDGKQFVIIFYNLQTDSRDSSQESVGTVKQEKSEVPQEELSQEVKPELYSTNAQEKETETPQAGQKKRKYPEVKLIPNTKEILELLRKQYGELLKTLNERKKLKTTANVKKFFREEYDKSGQSFTEVKIVKKLMEFSDSVCQIRIDGSAVGSGFLLFDEFVLTNAHVVENCLSNPDRNPDLNFKHNLKLTCKLTAVFHFDDLNSVGSVIEVKENIVAYWKGKDPKGNYLDFAFLGLSNFDGTDKYPTRLIQCYSAPPVRGRVCIIGHPGGQVKQMDPCFIVPKEVLPQAVDAHFTQTQNYEAFNAITWKWSNEDIELHNSQINLNSCFYHGASGSPMFDDRGNLIGVYTGGYDYKDTGKKMRSVVEYGLPMFPILVHIYIQCRENARSEAVKNLDSQKNLIYVVQSAINQLPARPEPMDTSD